MSLLLLHVKALHVGRVNIVCACMAAGNSPKGSILLAQLFLESAINFNNDTYGRAKSEGLKKLKDVFKSSIPDDYEQVRLFMMLLLLLAALNNLRLTCHNASHAFCIAAA